MAKTLRPDPSWLDGLTTFQQSLFHKTTKCELEDVEEKISAMLDKWEAEGQRGADAPNPAAMVGYIRKEIKKIFAES